VLCCSGTARARPSTASGSAPAVHVRPIARSAGDLGINASSRAGTATRIALSTPTAGHSHAGRGSSTTTRLWSASQATPCSAPVTATAQSPTSTVTTTATEDRQVN
jgi:hypothetical protein